jgi:predicted metal-dependent phosphotriesterase family hydrolase
VAALRSDGLSVPRRKHQDTTAAWDAIGRMSEAHVDEATIGRMSEAHVDEATIARMFGANAAKQFGVQLVQKIGA